MPMGWGMNAKLNFRIAKLNFRIAKLNFRNVKFNVASVTAKMHKKRDAQKNNCQKTCR